MKNKIIKVAGLGIVAIGLGVSAGIPDIYKKYKKSKEKQKEIDEIRAKQKAALEELKKYDIDDERHKELISEIMKYNKELMRLWNEQLAK